MTRNFAASQLMAADADHDAREHLQNMRGALNEGPEPDATDWYGRPEPITPALKARADAEWLAMDAKGQLPNA